MSYSNPVEDEVIGSYRYLAARGGWHLDGSSKTTFGGSTESPPSESSGALASKDTIDDGSLIDDGVISESKLDAATQTKLNSTPAGGSVDETSDIADDIVTEPKLSAAVRTKLNAVGTGGDGTSIGPYQEAVNAGEFTGTWSQWLDSLEGPAGTSGGFNSGLTLADFANKAALSTAIENQYEAGGVQFIHLDDAVYSDVIRLDDANSRFYQMGTGKLEQLTENKQILLVQDPANFSEYIGNIVVDGQSFGPHTRGNLHDFYCVATLNNEFSRYSNLYAEEVQGVIRLGYRLLNDDPGDGSAELFPTTNKWIQSASRWNIVENILANDAFEIVVEHPHGKYSVVNNVIAANPSEVRSNQHGIRTVGSARGVMYNNIVMMHRNQSAVTFQERTEECRYNNIFAKDCQDGFRVWCNVSWRARHSFNGTLRDIDRYGIFLDLATNCDINAIIKNSGITQGVNASHALQTGLPATAAESALMISESKNGKCSAPSGAHQLKALISESRKGALIQSDANMLNLLIDNTTEADPNECSGDYALGDVMMVDNDGGGGHAWTQSGDFASIRFNAKQDSNNLVEWSGNQGVIDGVIDGNLTLSGNNNRVNANVRGNIINTGTGNFYAPGVPVPSGTASM